MSPGVSADYQPLEEDSPPTLSWEELTQSKVRILPIACGW
jgi:hypothetical protein